MQEHLRKMYLLLLLSILIFFISGIFLLQIGHNKYNSFVGYPSNVTKLVGDLNGYTEIDSIHLENVNATENELNEIERLLKMGVIL